MAQWRPDMQFAIQQLSTQVLNPTTESKRAVKQLIRNPKGTQHTCLRLEQRGMVQKGLLELVGRSDSWLRLGRRFANTPECNGISLQCAERDDVQPKSETKQSVSVHAKESSTQPVLAQENLLGLAELFKELHYNVSVRLEMDSDSARHILQRKGPGGLKNIEIRCFAIQQWVREKRLSVGREWTRRTTQQSLHETSGWIATTVACEEARASNPGWYRWYVCTNGTNDNGWEVMTTASF